MGRRIGEREEIFRTSSNLIKYLESRDISPWADLFRENGISLSENLIIEPVISDLWRIIDKDAFKREIDVFYRRDYLTRENDLPFVFKIEYDNNKTETSTYEIESDQNRNQLIIYRRNYQYRISPEGRSPSKDKYLNEVSTNLITTGRIAAIYLSPLSYKEGEEPKPPR